MPPSALLSLRDIAISFGDFKALQAIQADFHAGEIHALLGENGAGKSTLIKVITGVYQPDEGQLFLDGQAYRAGGSAEAQALGISTVYQEVNLIPTLTVAQNLSLGRQPTRFGLVRWGAAQRQARALLARLELEIDVNRPLGSYSIAIQQLVAIARALALDAKVLILDEPTASLDGHEVEVLFGLLRQLRAQGMAIVFVTHFLDQVYALCDRITVLRNGRLVTSAPIAELPRLKLVEQMLGRQLAPSDSPTQDTARQSDKQQHPLLLEVDRLGRKRMLEPLSFSLRQGETLGLAGLLGSGRTETVKLLFGAERADSGQLRLAGAPCTIHNPRQAIRQGLGFCPEDRKREGLVLELSVRENLILALQAKRGWRKPIPEAQQQQLADEMIRALGIATPDAEKPVGQLSGGNQQKVILGRWLIAQPRLLILDEPTRGIDVGAHAEIVALIRRLCAEGMSLLVVSSELDEVVVFSDRIMVMRDRFKAAELTAPLHPNDIIKAIAS
ncbi:sugar ABC transporter ATP-binding protein [Pseudaeromonas paramecii]|uniref:Sugar ABC transporter ATP-binding protein n=1 Tax=Pseudaeromonas paramecii TaxID=2138166 RepID=A0ABP8PYM8_9GAMM